MAMFKGIILMCCIMGITMCVSSCTPVAEGAESGGDGLGGEGVGGHGGHGGH